MFDKTGPVGAAALPGIGAAEVELPGTGILRTRLSVSGKKPDRIPLNRTEAGVDSTGFSTGFGGRGGGCGLAEETGCDSEIPSPMAESSSSSSSSMDFASLLSSISRVESVTPKLGFRLMASSRFRLSELFRSLKKCRNAFLEQRKLETGPWWWSSGQHPLHLLQRYEFESR